MKWFQHPVLLCWTIAAVLAFAVVLHLGVAFFSRHIALTASFASGLILLLLALHLGIAGPVYLLIRKRIRR